MSVRRALPVLALLAACGAPPASPPEELAAPVEPAAVEGPIAATVDGDPIGLAEVERTARDTGLTPLAALHRLEQERALLHRAQRADLGADAEAESTARRAAIQALLHARVEDPHDEASITEPEIARRYEASRTAWTRPERRISVHVLAAPHDRADESARAEATRFVRAAIARMRAAADPTAEASVISSEGDEGRSFDVTVETLPPVTRHGPLEEPFLAALFALDAPGVAPEPVTTSFGVHAVALAAIEPPFEISLAEATPILRRQLVVEHRAAALDALTTDLRAHARVAIDERRAASVFSADLSEQATP